MSELKRQVRPNHPGVMLQELFLKPRGIKKGEFAQALDMSAKNLSLVINAKQAISSITAVKLALVLGTSPELWMNAQAKYDLFEANEKLDGWAPERKWQPDLAQHL